MLPKVKELTEMRKAHISARWNSHGSLESFREIFSKIAASNFLTSGWGGCTFDWLIKSPTNWAKVDEGNYDNDRYKKGGYNAKVKRGIPRDYKPADEQ
jgi:hypothetical protein